MNKFAGIIGYGLTATALAWVIFLHLNAEPNTNSSQAGPGAANAGAATGLEEAGGSLVNRTAIAAQLEEVDRNIEQTRRLLASVPASADSGSPQALEALKQRAYREAKEEYSAEHPPVARAKQPNTPISDEAHMAVARNFAEGMHRPVLQKIGITNPRLDELIADLLEAIEQQQLLFQQKERGEMTDAEYREQLKALNSDEILAAALSPAELQAYKIAEKEHSDERQRTQVFDGLTWEAPGLSQETRNLVADTFMESRLPLSIDGTGDEAEARTNRMLAEIDATLKALAGKLSDEEMEAVSRYFQQREQMAIEVEAMLKRMQDNEEDTGQ